MKKLLPFLTLILICALSEAQSTKGFAFQGCARNASGEIMQNKGAIIRFTLYVDDVNNPAYTEIQTLSTDDNGIFSAEVGSIDNTSYNAIDFDAYDYTLKVEVFAEDSAYHEVGNKMLLAAPYAKVAKKIKVGGNGVAIGCIVPFAGEVDDLPVGWHMCDGGNMDTTQYADLFAVIGYAWGGEGDTFKVPDLRGAFLRGVDHGQEIDEDSENRVAMNGGNTGDKVGSYQYCAIKSHSHEGKKTTEVGNHTHNFEGYSAPDLQASTASSTDIVLDNGDGFGNTSTTADENTIEAGAHSHTFTTDSTGVMETRPENMAVNYIIRVE